MNMLVWLLEQYGKLSAWWRQDTLEDFGRLGTFASPDEAIAVNAFKYRPGMEFPDEAIMERIGQRAWQRTEAAQRRLKG